MKGFRNKNSRRGAEDLKNFLAFTLTRNRNWGVPDAGSLLRIFSLCAYAPLRENLYLSLSYSLFFWKFFFQGCEGRDGNKGGNIPSQPGHFLHDPGTQEDAIFTRRQEDRLDLRL